MGKKYKVVNDYKKSSSIFEDTHFLELNNNSEFCKKCSPSLHAGLGPLVSGCNFNLAESAQCPYIFVYF